MEEEQILIMTTVVFEAVSVEDHTDLVLFVGLFVCLLFFACFTFIADVLLLEHCEKRTVTKKEKV